ncbi:DUF3859 domain-containing protein [Metapseudomonas resinovorans]|uniref:DUF3859 domain-containing protein n=1 Tax=Metapseudomonas resinovorans NBRC 106553 TaxID=1245471 RepID=S6AQ90_METRE|nr:DUF3859 domain-containing protein [Pseudomonas resinovorans]BAN47918.1 hypothetical protein PCA10_21860 [Pseudomonas resinovorans NBRC 106553]
MIPFRMTALVAFGLASGMALADVRVDGPIEYGIFESQYKDYQPGERVLTRSNQTIQRTDVIPAKLGTKFGMRYTLTGKQEKDTPLTLLYLTPGVVSPDGKRHDKFVVEQQMAAGAPLDVMAFEFTEHYEVVPGEWRFMVFQGDRLLAEQSFTVR